MLKVHVPQTSQNNQSCLPNITMKPLPLLSATKTSPCLMLVNWLTRSLPKLVKTTLPYPCYPPGTSHTNINLRRLPIEAFRCRHPLCTTDNQLLEGWKCSPSCQMTSQYQEQTSHIIFYLF